MTAEVLGSLVENHRELVRFVASRVGSHDLAKDIVQEAFVRGIDKIGTLREAESATAWFYRALRNAIIDHHRRRQSSAKALEAYRAEVEDVVEPPAEIRDVVCRCVSRLANTLKPEYRAALERIEVDGLSVTAFAQEQGITANNASVRIFRARAELRKRIIASCGACAEHGCLSCTCTHAPAS